VESIRAVHSTGMKVLGLLQLSLLEKRLPRCAGLTLEGELSSFRMRKVAHPLLSSSFLEVCKKRFRVSVNVCAVASLSEGVMNRDLLLGKTGHDSHSPASSRCC
jgi:hypothetical protein